MFALWSLVNHIPIKSRVSIKKIKWATQDHPPYDLESIFGENVKFRLEHSRKFCTSSTRLLKFYNIMRV